MAVSARSEAILDLGRRIVEQLRLDQEADILSRWMAYYVAELIHGIETANDESRASQLSKCADAILELWKYRATLPRGGRPFEDLDAILRALENLGSESQRPRYYPELLAQASETEERSEASEWIRKALSLDEAAKICIRYCLTRASRSSVDRARPWIELAEAAGLEDSVELQVVNLFASETHILESALQDRYRKQIEDRIVRLESFMKISNLLISDLRKCLEESPPSQPGSEFSADGE